MVWRACSRSCEHLLGFGQTLPVLSHVGVDALAIDGVLIELGLVPMHLGIPYVHVSNSLHYDFSGHTPLFAFDTAG
jgi:hypothetical protein